MIRELDDFRDSLRELEPNKTADRNTQRERKLAELESDV
jgi:hypothetical protein